MVDEQIAERGVSDPRVLDALRSVPRHEFVPAYLRNEAYDDEPLPIGHSQTISQPYIVGLMTELLHIKPSDRILEIGTGSGYQAAVLSELASEVDTIEIVQPLAERAKHDLARLGYDNVFVHTGDGYRGLPERAPFDGIIVTAAAPSVPKPLLEQLAVGAHLVIPVGDWDQELLVVTRTHTGFSRRTEIPVRFVPMTGRAREE
jgi:protein-L-isoaspartate(D-aspartate) O-methyltransferase